MRNVGEATLPNIILIDTASVRKMYYSANFSEIPGFRYEQIIINFQ